MGLLMQVGLGLGGRMLVPWQRAAIRASPEFQQRRQFVWELLRRELPGLT